jgi:hypothetical protein
LAEGLYQAGGQVGRERSSELRGVAQEAKRELHGMLTSDEDRQPATALRLLEQDDAVVLAGVGDPADVPDRHVEEVAAGGGWHDVLLGATR